MRDKQIEELTEQANQLQFRNGELSEKLATIRVDMGLPAQEADEANGLGPTAEKPKALMQVRSAVAQWDTEMEIYAYCTVYTHRPLNRLNREN